MVFSVRMVLVSVMVLYLLELSSASKCRDGQFLDRKLRQCVACTQCPDDLAVIRRCYGHHDTKCGAFPRFDFLPIRQSEEHKPESEIDEPQTEEFPSSTMQQQVVTTAENNKWYTITMVMIGVLVGTSVLVLVLLLITYFICRKKQRKVIRDPVFTSALLTDANKISKLEVITET